MTPNKSSDETVPRSGAGARATAAVPLDPGSLFDAVPLALLVIDGDGRVRMANKALERDFGWRPDEVLGRTVDTLLPELLARPDHDAVEPSEARASQRATQPAWPRGITEVRRTHIVHRAGHDMPVECAVSCVGADDAPVFVTIVRTASNDVELERRLTLLHAVAHRVGSETTLADVLRRTLADVGSATGWCCAELIPCAGESSRGVAYGWMVPAAPTDSGTSGADGDRAAGCLLELPRGVTGAPGAPLERARESAEPLLLGGEELVELLRTSFEWIPAAARSPETGATAAIAFPIHAAGALEAILVFLVRRIDDDDRRILESVHAATTVLGELIRRRRVEDAIEHANERLAERVRRRTRELEDSVARQPIVERLASIGTMAAGLGHDIGNMLLPMRAHLNALTGDESKLDPRARAHVAGVRRGLAYFESLSDGLRFLSTDADLETSSVGTDLARWWARTGTLIEAILPSRVRLHVGLPPHLPLVAITPSGLTQSVLNLVTNALHAIPDERDDGLVEIRACLDAAPKARDRDAFIRLEVRDNGCGMSEGVRRQATDLFFTTGTRGMGTGLGLPLVRRIVELAGGRLELESSEGRGTTARLVLPLDPRATEAGSEPDDRIAVVSLLDGRTASLAQQILQGAGFAATIADEPDGAAIWVVDPSTVTSARAVTWRDRHPRAVLVVFGDPGAWTDWRDADPLGFVDPSDFEAIRDTLRRAADAAAFERE